MGKTLETSSAQFTLGDDGVLRGELTVPEHTVAHAHENVSKVSAFVGQGKRVPLILDIRKTSDLPTEAQKAYVAMQEKVLSALALVTPSRVATLFGNLVLALHHRYGGKIPVKIFNDTPAAEAWIKSVREGSRAA